MAPEQQKCVQCGADLPADAPQGVCPKCLLNLGLSSAGGGADAAGSAAPRSSPAAARFDAPTPQALAPFFPQLEILELLGRGGMGAVYKARQPGLDRLVALKVLPAEVGRDPAFAERFTREARALAKLNHPHIVAVYDFGQTGDLCYFVMEYVDGANLRHLMRSGGVTPDQAMAIVPQVCEALQYAHDEGIVHRDVKPENILLDQKGRVKIADFGLAKLLGRTQAELSLTGTHQVMGTLHYMAPEQLETPSAVDHRADIFSLGVVFYELLTGQLPMGRFEPPSHRVRVDVRLDEVVLRSLEREPSRRYQKASQVKTAVESISSAHVATAAFPRMPGEMPRARTGRAISLPFTIPNVYEVAQAHGIARFDGRQFTLEFEVVDEFVGVFKSGLKDVSIAVEDLVSIELRRGLIRSRVVVQTDYLRAAIKIPGMQRGRFVLHVTGGDRAVAERFVDSVRRAIAGQPWEPSDSSVKTDSAVKAAEDADRAAARSLVAAPAIGLVLAGMVNLIPLFVLLVSVVMQAPNWVWLDDGGSPTTPALAVALPSTLAVYDSGSMWMLPICGMTLIHLPVAGLLILGGLNMWRFQTYGLAVMAAIIALIPCHAGFVIGLPVGIWALMILAKPEVKRAFRGPRHPAQRHGAPGGPELVPIYSAEAGQSQARSWQDESRYWAGKYADWPASGGQVSPAGRAEAPAKPVAPIRRASDSGGSRIDSVIAGTFARQLKAPAIALLVVGILNCVFAMVQWSAVLAGRVGVWELGMLTANWVASTVIGAMTIAGAHNMLQRRSYALAMAGAIASVVPCTIMWVLSLCFGIWALIVLTRPGIKRAFGGGADKYDYDSAVALSEARRFAERGAKAIAGDELDLARRRLAWPSSLLRASAVLDVISLAGWIIFCVVMCVSHQGPPPYPDTSIFVVLLSLRLSYGLFVLSASYRMKYLRSYGACVVASLLSLVPASPGWLLGAPGGMWALLVLADPKVREAFARSRATQASGRRTGLLAWLMWLAPTLVIFTLAGAIFVWSYVDWEAKRAAEPPEPPPSATLPPDGPPDDGSQWDKLTMTDAGPTLTKQGRFNLGLDLQEADQVNQSLHELYRQFLEEEGKHLTVSKDERGHVVLSFQEFPAEIEAIENEFWSAVDPLFGTELQRRHARSILTFEPMLFPYGTHWRLEVWKIGSFYYWGSDRMELSAFNGESLPPEIQRLRDIIDTNLAPTIERPPGDINEP